MTDLRQALRDTVAGPLYDDLDPRVVLAEARRRKARRQRWLVGGGVLATAATIAVAVLVGQVLVGERDEPEPAPAPVERVDSLLLESASPFPSRPIHTHHEPAPSDPDRYGLDTDALVGVTSDGMAVRIRNVYRGDSTTFGLVDPQTGATEWLPDHGYDLGDPAALRLESDRLVFIDNRDLTSDILVFDRVTGTWEKHEIQVRVGSQRMYPQETTMTLAPDGRLWFVAYPAPSQTHPTCLEGVEADPGCWIQWWSVPFPDGGQAQREPDADRKRLAWSGDTLATSSTDGITVSRDGEDTTVPLGAPEGCDVRSGDVPYVHSADPLVITVACADDTSAVTVYGESHDPLYSVPVPGSVSVSAVGQGFVGLTRLSSNGAPQSTHLLDIADRRLYELTAEGRTVVTGIAGGMVLWQSPEPSWFVPNGHDYWVAPLP